MSNQERYEPNKTLYDALGNSNTTQAQKVAMNILDGFKNLTTQERKTLFYYHLWEEADGSFAPIKDFGELREDIPFILDRVMESDYLVDAYDNFTKKYAMRGKKSDEFLQLLDEGINPEDAIKEMGLSFESDDKNKTNHEKFVNFCKQVEMIERPEISDHEIARALGQSETRVKRARRRLREEGRARQRTVKEVSMANSRRFTLLKAEIKNSDVNELVEKTVEKTGATRQQVLHQRSVLFERGEIKKKTREQAKRRLKRILKNNSTGTSINLSEIYRTANLGVSWSTIQSLYHEIKETQVVPELKYQPRRRSKN